MTKLNAKENFIQFKNNKILTQRKYVLLQYLSYLKVGQSGEVGGEVMPNALHRSLQHQAPD